MQSDIIANTKDCKAAAGAVCKKIPAEADK